MCEERKGCYIGRSNTEVQYVLDMLRDNDYTITDPKYLESMFLYGLLQLDDTLSEVMLVNIGGSLFHMRVLVAKRIPYFRALLEWPGGERDQSFLFDYSKTLIDRNPYKFVNILNYVEVYGSSEELLMTVSRDAAFFNIQHDPDLCFLCRQDKAETSQLPCGHRGCKTCQNQERCNVCLNQSLEQDSEMSEMSEMSNMPSYPKWSITNGCVALVAKGAQDDHLTRLGSSQGLKTIHTSKWCSLSRSNFTFGTHACTREISGAWSLTIPRDCDLLGDCWICLDFETPSHNFPQDLWDLCHIISTIEVISESTIFVNITAPILFAMVSIGEIPPPVIEPLNSKCTRLVIPLLSFWWRLPGSKLRLISMQHMYPVLRVSTSNSARSRWKAESCLMVCTKWFVDDNERRCMAQTSYQDPIVLCSAMRFETSGSTQFVHKEYLYFNHPTKDLIIVVRPHEVLPDPHSSKETYNSETWGMTGPLRLVEIQSYERHMLLSLDGLFSRKILGDHMYEIKQQSDHYLYFLPFDSLVRRQDLVSQAGPLTISTCNFSRIDSLTLHLTLLPGKYDIHVISRYINILHYSSGVCGIKYAS